MEGQCLGRMRAKAAERAVRGLAAAGAHFAAFCCFSLSLSKAVRHTGFFVPPHPPNPLFFSPSTQQAFNATAVVRHMRKLQLGTSLEGPSQITPTSPCRGHLLPEEEEEEEEDELGNGEEESRKFWTNSEFISGSRLSYGKKTSASVCNFTSSGCFSY